MWQGGLRHVRLVAGVLNMVLRQTEHIHIGACLAVAKACQSLQTSSCRLAGPS